MTDAQTQTTEITNHGQIAKMIFPPGWVEGRPWKNEGGIGAKSFREVHPADAPDATVCFYYRGLPVSDEAAKNFVSVLQKPSHMLSAKECSTLGEILRDKAEADFKTVVCRTEAFNGRQVLLIEGRYNHFQDDTYAMCIDADGSGKFVQEIYYRAPKELYLRYLTDAKEAIRSLQWR